MKLGLEQAAQLLARIHGRNVTVVGDLMLDEYLFGEVNRISPEAPVPVVRVLREHAVLGGAANVAANLKAIGAEPCLVGTLQDDRAGQRMLELLAQQGIGAEGIVLDPSRPTIIKTRVIGQQQQMLRIDREEPGTPKEATLEALKHSLARSLDGAGALIVSDYAKGTIDASLMATLREGCLTTGVPWIVDPKPAHRAFYRGATLMTPNTKELTELTGLPAKTDEEVATAGRRLAEELDVAGILVTRSEKGMALLTSDALHREPWWIATDAREVFDVSGAGDTVIAVFSAAVAAGADWQDAAMLANAAAGIVVGKMGTATVTPQELLARFQAQEAR